MSPSQSGTILMPLIQGALSSGRRRVAYATPAVLDVDDLPVGRGQAGNLVAGGRAGRGLGGRGASLPLPTHRLRKLESVKVGAPADCGCGQLRILHQITGQGEPEAPIDHPQ